LITIIGNVCKEIIETLDMREK